MAGQVAVIYWSFHYGRMDGKRQTGPSRAVEVDQDSIP
jgi:hypothetical protein